LVLLFGLSEWWEQAKRTLIETLRCRYCGGKRYRRSRKHERGGLAEGRSKAFDGVPWKGRSPREHPAWARC
jgi:hypothetical protein